MVDNFVLDKVKLDSIVDFDSWVGVSDGSSIVGDNVWDTLGTELMSSDFAEFEVGLFGGDSVDGESTLDIVKESEVFTGSLNRDDIHESSWESLVGSDLSVDLDESLLNNGSNLSAGKGVLQSVSKEDGEGEGLSELVRSGRRSGGLDVNVGRHVEI